MPGLFVTLDGPGGAGKSTTTTQLAALLTQRGYPVHATTQPSRGELGQIARHRSNIYRGHALACLVAADRYHHLRTDIRPRKAAGDVVVCDRYVAASLVLQRMDGVPLDFLETLNRGTGSRQESRPAPRRRSYTARPLCGSPAPGTPSP